MEATPLTWHNFFESVEGIVAAATILLALITGGLAAATFWMARKTAALAASTADEVIAVGDEIELSRQSVNAIRDQVDVARTEVEVSRQAVETQIRPVLVDVRRPTDPAEIAGGMAQEQDEVAWQGAAERRRAPTTDAIAWETDEAVYLSVPLRNVGPGTAFIRGIGIQWRRPLPGVGTPTMAVVPPGERTRIQLSVRKADGEPSLAEFIEEGSFTVEVSYTDVAGGQWTLTRAIVNLDRVYNRWYVTQVFLHHKRGDRPDGSVDWGDEVAASGAAWGV